MKSFLVNTSKASSACSYHSKERKALRVLYAAGPGDIIGTHHHWLEQRDDPSQVAVTYSGQFYEVCRELNLQAYVLSSCDRKQFLSLGQFTLHHCPPPLPLKSGLHYHFNQIWSGLHLLWIALRFRADVVVVSSGTTHWFVLSLFPRLGIAVVPTLHCMLWRKFSSIRRGERWLLQLGRRLFAKDALAILVASADIAEQLDQLTQSRSLSCVPFLPTYRRTEFACIRPPERNDNLSFKVLYAGRIERNKGVFELLEIARRFGAEAHQNISFDICGAGSALEELKALSQKAGVDSTFLCHGHCNKQQMQQMFSQSHTVIVPTTTDFIEGFNQVVAEGILSGRPVITSAVCPAIAYLHNAVVEVPPNDTKAYGDAILKLRDDQVLYEQKRQACLDMQEQFYDPANSWGIALKSVLESMP